MRGGREGEREKARVWARVCERAVSRAVGTWHAALRGRRFKTSHTNARPSPSSTLPNLFLVVALCSSSARLEQVRICSLERKHQSIGVDPEASVHSMQKHHTWSMDATRTRDWRSSAYSFDQLLEHRRVLWTLNPKRLLTHAHRVQCALGFSPPGHHVAHAYTRECLARCAPIGLLTEE